MEVHIIVHSWDLPDEWGAEALGVYTDHSKAVREMRRMADETIENTDYEHEFDEDLCHDDNELIKRGWYVESWGQDSVWKWELQTMEVE